MFDTEKFKNALIFVPSFSTVTLYCIRSSQLILSFSCFQHLLREIKLISTTVLIYR